MIRISVPCVIVPGCGKTLDMKTIVVSILCTIFCAALAEAKTDVTKQPFGKMPDGTPVDIFTLSDGTIEARIMSFGGIIVPLKAPDRKGKMEDVVLGFDTLDEYVANSHNYYGAVIGRYANRIANGSFTLEGQKYSLPLNNGKNTLHGGPKRFLQCALEVKVHKERGGIHVLQQGWRRRLPWQSHSDGQVHARERRTASRVFG